MRIFFPPFFRPPSGLPVVARSGEAGIVDRDETRLTGPRIFAMGGGASLPREIDPSRASLFTPETRLSLARVFDRALERLIGDSQMRYRLAPQILRETGLSNGHFDPMYWLIDEWFNRRDRNQPIVVEPVRTLALTHYQKAPARPTKAHAARWIAYNIILQSHKMTLGRWPYPHARSLELFDARAQGALASATNEYWRSDAGGANGGLWFYPSEFFREESSHGDWMVIARLPREFTYHFLAHGALSVAILPGPLPHRNIVAQGPRENMLERIRRSHGGIEAYLRALEA